MSDRYYAKALIHTCIFFRILRQDLPLNLHPKARLLCLVVQDNTGSSTQPGVHVPSTGVTSRGGEAPATIDRTIKISSSPTEKKSDSRATTVQASGLGCSEMNKEAVWAASEDSKERRNKGFLELTAGMRTTVVSRGWGASHARGSWVSLCFTNTRLLSFFRVATHNPFNILQNYWHSKGTSASFFVGMTRYLCTRSNFASRC